MSYATLDHGGWVEQNGTAARTMGKPKKDKDGRVVGWHGCPEKLSPFHLRVMDILGMVGGGIYNAPIAWDAVRWGYGGGIAVPWRGHGHFATVDFDTLTRLVFLCHEARIRLEINTHGRDFLLVFHQRSHEGDNTDRHPNLDEAVAAFRSYLPADHRVPYVAERDDPLPGRRRRHLEYLAESGAKRTADRVAEALARGALDAAKRERDDVARDVARARRLAEMLGGGAELAALVAAAEAQAQRAQDLVAAAEAEAVAA